MRSGLSCTAAAALPPHNPRCSPRTCPTQISGYAHPDCTVELGEDCSLQLVNSKVNVVHQCVNKQCAPMLFRTSATTSSCEFIDCKVSDKWSVISVTYHFVRII